MTKIPFNYLLTRFGPFFQVSTVNEGFTLVRRLGFEIKGMILGKKEQEEIKVWLPNPVKEDDDLKKDFLPNYFRLVLKNLRKNLR